MIRPAELPTVSILIPCRNEAQHIGACLDSVLQTDYPHELLEVLVIDGTSDDGTCDVVRDYADRSDLVRLLHNPARITPTALNAGLRTARGDVIMRMDAHVTYPPDYVRGLVLALQSSGADGVGAVLQTCAGGENVMARAIAIALAHPFGVGNSLFRIGAHERRVVDTIPFGCYRREVFSRYGAFDEDLVRAQDEEFNYRITRRGGRIMLVPDVVARYFARGTLHQVARMYYQYGFFKPCVARKVGRIMTVRQLVPAALVGTLAVGGAGALAVPQLALPFVLIAATYAAAVLAFAARTAPGHGVRCAVALAAVFPVLHFSYGTGFLIGAAGLLRARGAPLIDVARVPLSR
jgi:glycosyltransferase involved in cell wall biosynthesis